ncbi:hypothetical protein [Leifsonia shinshuensis]
MSDDSAPAPTAEPVPPRALSKKTQRWLWAALAAVTIVTTAGGVTLSVAAVSALQSMPTLVVSQYLRALERGDATGAMKLAGIKARSGDILLTDAAYGTITDRIKSFTVAAPVTRAGTTTVSATITQGDRIYTRSFAIRKDGGIPWLPFWRLSPVEPETLDFLVDGPAGLTYTVAGLKPKSEPLDTDVRLRALPGSYPVEVTQRSKNFDVPTADVLTTPTGLTPSPTVLTALLSAAGKAAAQKAIDAWLDGCVASHDAEPANCPFWTVPGDPGDDISDVHWQLLTRPTADMLSEWTAGGWDVDSTSGSVGATALLTRRSDGSSGIGITDPFSFSFKGTVTFNGAGAVFTPLIDASPAQAGA